MANSKCSVVVTCPPRAPQNSGADLPLQEEDDRGTGWDWFEDAVRLMFAVLGVILSRLWTEVREIGGKKR